MLNGSGAVGLYRFQHAGQIEGVAFHSQAGKDDELILLSEERQLFGIPLSLFEEVR